MMGHKISAALRKTSNKHHGVVTVTEVMDVPVEEILESLKIQGVIDVRRIKIRENSECIMARSNTHFWHSHTSG